MSNYYSMNTKKTAAQTRRDIVEQFERWNPRYGASLIESYDFPQPSKIGGGEAQVRFVLRGLPITVACSSQYGYDDNLRCCLYAIESMRLNEKRGIADTMRNAYAQLAAPKAARDPYEVLGVRPDTDMEIIEAAYKAAAKKAHPDTGGTTEAMQEVNDALERIKAERNGTGKD